MSRWPRDEPDSADVLAMTRLGARQRRCSLNKVCARRQREGTARSRLHCASSSATDSGPSARLASRTA